MFKHPKKISEELLHENPWMKYKHDIFEDGVGGRGDYYYLENNGSVMIVPVLDDGRIILIRQYRYLQERESIELPCGGIDLEEQLQTAAERELFEETGYKGHEFVQVGVFDGINGLVKDTTHLFIATQLDKINEPQNDPSEYIELMFRRPDEVDNMVRQGEIWDGQTLAAWAMVHHHFLHKNN